MSKTEQTEREATDLGDELFRVAEDTTADGRVRVEIRDVSKVVYPEGDPEIAVTVRRPSMEEFTEQMAYPERDDPEYKFVRLCREAGYSLAAAEQLEGATVLADNDGGWSLVAEREPTWWDQIYPYLDALQFTGSLAVALLALPLSMGLVLAADDDDELADSTGDKILGWLLLTGIWVIVGRAGYILLTSPGVAEVPL